ncbi:polysaccharide lyase [Yoonia sp. 2307UL14-13]|uniref:polysaccharide lyase n=1 Tax=Yoonia sp. 2307UL14-13 TaxID=3126506 RepID=UPI0030B2091D
MTQDYTSTSGNTTSGAIVRGFDNHAVGNSYTRDLQEQDWDYRDGAGDTSEVATISDEHAVSGGQSLRVDYSSDERVKTASKWELPPEDEYFLSYWVRFDDDFSFNGVEKSGGKLPGLGADEVPTGGDDVTGENGFSARYMWRYDGQAELYLYHMDKAGTFGDSVKFRYDNGDYAFFETGKWHNIVQRVKTNTDDNPDGEIDVWLDGEQVVDIDGVRLSDNGQMIDVFYLSTFYGGGGTNWLPPEDTSAHFDEVVISTNASDVGIDPAAIRSPGENPDDRPIGDGVVKGIQPFEPEETTYELQDGTAAINHDKQWGDGYTATLTYTPDEDVSDWMIRVKTPGPLNDIWNAEIVSYDNGVYTLRATTKPELDAGESANIRIKGAGHGSLVEFVDGDESGNDNPQPPEPDPVEPDPIAPEPPSPVVPQPEPIDPTPIAGKVLIDREWDGGFTANVIFAPDAGTQDWSLMLKGDVDIKDIWNAEVIGRDDGVYTLRGTAYNRDLDAGEAVSIRIKGSGDAGSLKVLGADAPAAPDPQTEPPREISDAPVEGEDAPDAGGITTDFEVTGQWNGGFKAEVLLNNDTDQVISDWSMTFATDGYAIRRAWGGEMDEVDDNVMFEASPWFNGLLPGEALRIGFVADGEPPSALSDMSIQATTGEDGSLSAMMSGTSGPEHTDDDIAHALFAVSEDEKPEHTGTMTCSVGVDDPGPCTLFDPATDGGWF